MFRKALALLAPQMNDKQMSGGQIIAMLRLLMHVRNGGEICERSVFIQGEYPFKIAFVFTLSLVSSASPSSPSTSKFAKPLPISATTAMSSDPPQSLATSSNPPLLPSKTLPSPSSRNPFPTAQQPSGYDYDLSSSPRRASLSDATQRAPPVPPSSSKPRVDGFGVPPGTTNPFLQRAKTHSGAYDANAIALPSNRTPPLPPRKPSHMATSSSSVPRRPPPPSKPASLASSTLPPLIQQTSTGATASTSSNGSKHHQGTAPVLATHHITPLMQQSLLASRAGASLRESKEAAGRTRVLEVIRSSSDVATPGQSIHDTPLTQNYVPRLKSMSRSPEKGTRRRPVPLPPRHTASSVSARSDSGPPSEASLARVASARLPGARARTVSPGPTTLSESDEDSDSDERDEKARSRSISEQFEPPPVHPARRPSASAYGSPNRSSNRHIRSPSYQSYHFQSSQHLQHHPVSKSVYSPSFPETIPSSPPEETFASPPQSPSDSPFSGPSVSGGVLRPSRSRSMHSPVSPTLAGRLSGSTSPHTTGGPTNSSPTIAPPPRRRPESMQVPPRRSVPQSLSSAGRDKAEDSDLDPLSPFANTFDVESSHSHLKDGSITARFFRDLNLNERERERGTQTPAPFASLQRTFSALHQRAQPSLARARYKAEASMHPRRGFVPPSSSGSKSGREGGLLSLSDDADASEAGMDEELGYVDSTADGDDDETLRGRDRQWRKDVRDEWMERDNMKLPEGEGWRPL